MKKHKKAVISGYKINDKLKNVVHFYYMILTIKRDKCLWMQRKTLTRYLLKQFNVNCET